MLHSFYGIVLLVLIIPQLNACGGSSSDPEFSSEKSKYVYVTNYDGASISQYKIINDGSLQALNPGTVASHMGAYDIAISPDNKYAYVANFLADTLTQYNIGSDGALVAMTVHALVTGDSPISVSVHPTGQYVYVVNMDSSNISQFTVGADGSLTPMAQATVLTGSNPNSIAISPNGKYVYVTNGFSNDISQYLVNLDGTLSEITNAIACGNSPKSVIVGKSGQYVYVAESGAQAISQYFIESDGSLTLMTAATVSLSTFSPSEIIVDHENKHAYVSSIGNAIEVFDIGVGGQLSSKSLTNAEFDSWPGSIAIEPTGNYAYVPGLNSDTVYQYLIDINGGLSPLLNPSADTGNYPASIAITN